MIELELDFEEARSLYFESVDNDREHNKVKCRDNAEGGCIFDPSGMDDDACNKCPYEKLELYVLEKFAKIIEEHITELLVPVMPDND